MVAREHARALPGVTGDVKCAANYGPAMLAQAKARQAGCQQVVWLDPVERRWIEEMGGMNLFFVIDGAVVTPPLTGTMLAGVTRDSLLTLAAREGYAVREARLSIDDWREGCANGSITETFACGTAAVVAPLGRVRNVDGDFTVGTGAEGRSRPHCAPPCSPCNTASCRRHRVGCTTLPSNACDRCFDGQHDRTACHRAR